MEGYDGAIYRKDACGAWMIKEEYGNEESMYGWEMDWIVPRSYLINVCGVDISKISRDCIENLRPMNCSNKAAKKNDFPMYRSVITADGVRNCYKACIYRVSLKLSDEIVKKISGGK